MKKILALSILIILVWALISFLSSDKKAEFKEGVETPIEVSSDDSLEVIEEELEETTLQEFESELD